MNRGLALRSLTLKRKFDIGYRHAARPKYEETNEWLQTARSVPGILPVFRSPEIQFRLYANTGDLERLLS